MPAIRIILSPIDNAALDDVVAELLVIAQATQSEQSLQYNSKWMKALPSDKPVDIIRRYAGEKQVPANTMR